MGSVKLQTSDTMSNVCAVAKPFDANGCRLCGTNYDEETNNNNQAVVDSDTETTTTTHDAKSNASWDETWTPKRFLDSPGTPSYIAKDANSLTFQWEAAAASCEAAPTYHVEMQEVDIRPGTTTPNQTTASQFVEDEAWESVYSGKECWTQVKSLHPGGYYAVRIRYKTEPDLFSDYSSIAILHTTPTIPSGPLPPELTGIQHDAMTLEWRDPWEHGGSDITGYRLQMCPPPGDSPEDLVRQPLPSLTDASTDGHPSKRLCVEI